jgi:hypothetical protein
MPIQGQREVEEEVYPYHKAYSAENVSVSESVGLTVIKGGS